MSSNSMRLQKFLAMAGIASRREAEVLISAGKIKVNGKLVVTPGVRVGEQDVVSYGNKIIDPPSAIVLLFHKPKGFTCNKDSRYPGKSIYDICPELGNLPVSIGLEKTASGIILLTNDGTLHQSLTKTLRTIQRHFHVRVKEKISEKDIEKLCRGVALNGKRAPLRKVEFNKTENGRFWYEVVMSGQKDGLLEKLFLALRHPVQKLVQVSIAGIHDGHLKKSKCRELTYKECQQLRELVGLEKG